MIRLDDQNHAAIRERLAKMEASKNPVKWLYDHTMMNMGDISKATGLSPSMAAALRQGKRPGPCQKAACRWALVAYELNI